jgi:hypothetical protein
VTEGQIAIVRLMRAEGATKVTFHADGAVAAVEFGPAEFPHEEIQREEPVTGAASYPRRATGGLIPREVDRQ